MLVIGDDQVGSISDEQPLGIKETQRPKRGTSRLNQPCKGSVSLSRANLRRRSWSRGVWP